MIERDTAVNWSTLSAMRVSPKHYRHLLANPRVDTEAFLLGRLTHCLVYEPAEVSKRYIREPNFHRGMKDETARVKGYDGGKESAAQFEIECVSRALEVVPHALWTRADAMCLALRSDNNAAPLLVGGYAEQLVTWIDAATGIECRGRIDHINGRLSDLKTTRSISPREFASSVIRLGYHAQLAYYHDGLLANGIVLDEPPALIAVENEAPFDVAVFEFSEADLRAGRRVYRECLSKLAECRLLDKWPGVSNGTRLQIALPEWAMPEPELTLNGEPI